MKVECHHCQKKYTLPQERVAGRILKIRCRQCSELFEVDGSEIKLNESSINQGEGQAALHVGKQDETQAPALKTMEYSAISTAELDSLRAKALQNEPQMTPPPSSNSLNSNALALSVEVSQSAQEWMESVMSDVDRPITQEIRVEEITGHHALPPPAKSSAPLFVALGLSLAAGGYFLLQVPSTQRVSPTVVTLNLNDLPAQKEGKSDISANQDLDDKLTSEGSPTELTATADQGDSAELEKNSNSKMPNSETNEKAPSFEEMSKTLALAKSESRNPSPELEGDLSAARVQAKKDLKTQVTVQTKTEETAQNKPKSKSQNMPKESPKTKGISAIKRNDKSSKVRSASKRSSKPSRSTKRSTQSSGKGLDKATIATVMNQNGSGLQHCYQTTLKRDPNFGEVNTRLNFTVEPTGRVSRSTIKLSGVYRNTRLESCIQNTIIRWYFPKAEGNTPVRYPLRFRQGF